MWYKSNFQMKNSQQDVQDPHQARRVVEQQTTVTLHHPALAGQEAGLCRHQNLK
jgi:hypothetical protein